LRLQRHDARRNLVLRDDSRSLDLIAQIEQMLAITRSATTRGQDGAQALDIRARDDDSVVPPHD
jgi:hypothetical protein